MKRIAKINLGINLTLVKKRNY